MEEQERYEQVCKPAFERLETKTDQILTILQGSNGTPGLSEQVRSLSRFRKITLAVLAFLGSSVFIQLLFFLRAFFLDRNGG